MNKYKIPCTKAQIEKAFELGAKLDIIDCDVWLEERLHNAPLDFPTECTKMTDYLYDDNYERRKDVMLIEGTEEYGDMVVCIPTAEEMIGWLEEQEGIDRIVIDRDQITKGRWVFDIFENEKNECSNFYGSCYHSRKEAILAAIDAALEYLNKRNNLIK